MDDFANLNDGLQPEFDLEFWLMIRFNYTSQPVLWEGFFNAC